MVHTQCFIQIIYLQVLYTMYVYIYTLLENKISKLLLERQKIRRNCKQYNNIRYIHRLFQLFRITLVELNKFKIYIL